MAQLNRGSNIDQIQERAAAISPNGAGSGSGLGPGMSAAIGATHARQFQRAVLFFLETVKAESLRKSGPADKKLLKDIRQKAPGSFSHHAQRKKPFEESELSNSHNIISGVGALPALGGVRFDVDWDNVSAFMGLLQSLEVAGPEDHSGDWHMVQPFNRYHGSSRFQRISNRPILENSINCVFVEFAFELTNRKNVHVCLHVCWDLSKHTCKCVFLFRFINKRNPKHQMFSKGNPKHCKRNPKPWISRQQEKPKPVNFLPREIPTGRVPAKRHPNQQISQNAHAHLHVCWVLLQHTCNCACMFGFLAKGRNPKQQIYHQEKS